MPGLRAAHARERLSGLQRRGAVRAVHQNTPNTGTTNYIF
jgi:hypothetical protein